MRSGRGEKDDAESRMFEAVDRKAARRGRARREKDRTVWYGLGMFGLVGWAVAVPTLILLGAGIWVDRAYPSRVSWTLTGLILGVALGCLNAWYWVKREGKDV